MKKRKFNLKAFINRPKAAFIAFVFVLLAYVGLSLGYTVPKTVKILYVIDGDTVIARLHKKRIKIRLFGIDAPESTQKYGQASKRYLQKLVAKSSVKLVIKDRDKYGRYLGVLHKNGNDINRLMVKAGAAWAYKFYTKAYVSEEKRARRLRLGLWKQKNPMNPYKYRKGHKWKQNSWF